MFFNLFIHDWNNKRRYFWSVRFTSCVCLIAAERKTKKKIPKNRFGWTFLVVADHKQQWKPRSLNQTNAKKKQLKSNLVKKKCGIQNDDPLCLLVGWLETNKQTIDKWNHHHAHRTLHSIHSTTKKSKRKILKPLEFHYYFLDVDDAMDFFITFIFISFVFIFCIFVWSFQKWDFKSSNFSGQKIPIHVHGWR